jgi:hypothetical protein
MTTYTLTPTTMVNYPQAEGQQDVVFRVVWNYSGVDGDYTSSFSGQTDLMYMAGTPFTPYAQLTQDQVVSWVLAAWGPEGTAANQAQIDAAIALEKNPPTQVLPLPWAPPEPASATPAVAPAV